MGANNSTSQHDDDQVVEIETRSQWKQHFESCKQTNNLYVIDFTANWCGPCKRIHPTIQEYAATYTDVQFLTIDVDKFPDVAKLFNVEAMPTFVLLKQGKEVERVIGAKKDELQLKIEKNRS